MRFFFYAPMKPLGHSNPSGDLVIAEDLFRFLGECGGHDVRLVSALRTRWIYWKPWLWPAALKNYRQARKRVMDERPRLWLTYHAYYKAPDLLGPSLSRLARIPYVILEASYATRKRKNLKTMPGFYLNRRALLSADCIIANRREDFVNLQRIIPENRLRYVPPGIQPDDFRYNPFSRENLRRVLSIGDSRLVVAAAMFRPGVKTQGLTWVIQACGRLARDGVDLVLLIVGDGREKDRLKRLAAEELGGRVRFAGQVPRSEMHRFYSAGDVFAFPGFQESLGMVYLEAQSCGLPVAAMNDGGVAEVVRDGETGLIAPYNDFDAFTENIRRLLADEPLRRQMSEAAMGYVRERHDLNKNYRTIETMLATLAKSGKPRPWYRPGRK